jgi:E3 ubiquitin-protein ligase BRE1
MREYKREKDTLESHLREVQKKSVDHDDHIRVINAWWDQVCRFSILDLPARADMSA